MKELHKKQEELINILNKIKLLKWKMNINSFNDVVSLPLSIKLLYTIESLIETSISLFSTNEINMIELSRKYLFDAIEILKVTEKEIKSSIEKDINEITQSNHLIKEKFNSEENLEKIEEIEKLFELLIDDDS